MSYPSLLGIVETLIELKDVCNAQLEEATIENDTNFIQIYENKIKVIQSMIDAYCDTMTSLKPDSDIITEDRRRE